MHAIHARQSQEGHNQPAERAQDHEMFLHKQLPASRRDGRFSMFAERASSLPGVRGAVVLPMEGDHADADRCTALYEHGQAGA
jgi:hypothetical protein